MRHQILVMRHAESLEDVSKNLQNLLPDSSIGLTEKGRQQTLSSISQISQFTQKIKRVFVSPSFRTKETLRIIDQNSNLLSDVEGFEDERLRNLNWGNITPVTKSTIEKERYRAGVLNYVFDGGDDSRAYSNDIRDFCCELKYLLLFDPEATTTLIVTHGFAFRVVLMHLTGMDEEVFRWLSNPPNAFIARLTLSRETFVLQTEMKTYQGT